MNTFTRLDFPPTYCSHQYVFPYSGETPNIYKYKYNRYHINYHKIV